MSYLKSNLKKVAIIILLMAGLVVSTYLVLKPQIFKSRAEADLNSIIQITSPSGEELKPDVNNTYTSTSEKLKIKLN